ncbi:MAG: hypothetical protein QNJ67_07665 [Kiloniellales bacterium]|nr:hypothetical protein [Kiloniellales bacterium]
MKSIKGAKTRPQIMLSSAGRAAASTAMPPNFGRTCGRDPGKVRAIATERPGDAP